MKKKKRVKALLSIICGVFVLIPFIQSFYNKHTVSEPKIVDKKIIELGLSYAGDVSGKYIYQDGLVLFNERADSLMYKFRLDNVALSVKGESVVKGGSVFIKGKKIEIEGEKSTKWPERYSFGQKENQMEPMVLQSHGVYLPISKKDYHTTISLETTLEADFPVKSDNGSTGFYINSSKFSRSFSLYVISRDELMLREKYYAWKNSSNDISLSVVLSLLPFMVIIYGVYELINSFRK